MTVPTRSSKRCWPGSSSAGLDVVVLADTHLLAGPDRLDPSVRAAVESCDVLLHAGDVVSIEALEGLQAMADTHAVLGNNDHQLVGALPETLSLVLAGVRVAMVHDSGPVAGRASRARRRFPEADLVVFGHSHAPADEAGADGQWLFNPGSPTQRRRQPYRTFGRLHLAAGRVVAHRIEVVG